MTSSIHFFADRPTPPVGPVVFEEVHREYMVISWKPPLDSGGVGVSNYVVEKRDVNRDMWSTVTAATTKTICKVSTRFSRTSYGRGHRWIEFKVNMLNL